jgi:RNA methyltransferase, TrmH family
VTISSPHNERIKAVRRLRRSSERRRTGKTLIEGPHLLEAAVAAGVVPEVVFAAAGDDVGTDAIPVSRAVLDAIAPTDAPRGPVAVIDVPLPAPLIAADTLVVWEVGDPGNVGTLIRSAAGFGWSVAVHGGADPWSPKVLRAGAGAHFAVPISAVDDLDELSAAGLSIVVTVPAGGVSPADLSVGGPVALLVGNEAAGLPAGIIDRVDARLTIPAFGLESLNVAVAGSIAMYALGHRV